MPASLRLPSAARGEAARVGERGVVTWVEGPRDGSRWSERDVSPDVTVGAASRQRSWPLLGVAAPKHPDAPQLVVVPRVIAADRPSMRTAPAIPAGPRPLDRFTQLRRRNE